VCFLRGLDWQVWRHSASSGLESQDWQGSLEWEGIRGELKLGAVLVLVTKVFQEKGS